jgi:hypothetical protein
MHNALTTMVASVGWTGSSSMSRKGLSELLFWSRNVRFNTPFSFVKRVSQAQLTTDASEEGWRAHI